MKKGFLFLGAAAILAIGSAFTTTSKASTEEYVRIGTEFIPLSEAGDGQCVEMDDEHCKYTLVSPNNYQPIPGDVNVTWQPL